MTDEIKAGIARRRAVYGTETTSELAENGVSATLAIYIGSSLDALGHIGPSGRASRRV